MRTRKAVQMNKRSGSTLMMRTGVEGPTYDPYSFEEYEVTRSSGETMKIHMGLVTWVQMNGGTREMGFNDATLYDDFERFAGTKFHKMCKVYMRAKSRCACGCTRTHSIAGYPGESFNVCDKCDNVVSMDFNERAVQ